MEFVIWGAGTKGKYLKNALGDMCIAFIDSDTSKIGTQYFGNPVISLDDYIKHYRDKFIIISTFSYHDIAELLEKKHIYDFFNVDDMPAKLKGFSSGRFFENLDRINFTEDVIYLYGLTAYSFIVEEMLTKKGKKVYIIAHEDMSKESYKAFRNKRSNVISYKEAYKKDIDTIYLVIETNKRDMKNLFPKTESNDITDFYDHYDSPVYKKLEKIKELKGEKERCFIIATGPSLLMEDLYTLKANREFSISVNEIIDCADKWKPNIYAISDSKYLEDMIDRVIDYDVDVKILLDMTFVDYGDDPRIYKYDVGNLGPRGSRFSEDITKVIYAIGTVIYVAIQIAVYMGFRDIYLLGVDCDYSLNNGKTHFNGNFDTDNKRSRVDDIFKSYLIVKEFADAHGINVYNATRGGKLEVFERVDFDSLF